MGKLDLSSQSIVIRHGKQLYPVASLYTSYVDSGNGEEYELTVEGRQQMLTAANRLHNVRNVLHSPKLVATEAALILAQGVNAPLETMDELDIIYHDFTLMTHQELWQADEPPQSEMVYLRSKFIELLWAGKFVHGLNYVKARLALVANQLNQPGNVLISHGTTMKILNIYMQNGLNCSADEAIALADVEQSYYGPVVGYSYPSLASVSLI